MSGVPETLAARYRAALAAALAQDGEAVLLEAYEIGRAALVAEVGMLDLTMLHHDTLGAMGAKAKPDLARAAEFLAECLSPFEMTLRGYRTANVALVDANANLERANQAAKAANERLMTEMSERRRAEAALRQSQKLQAVGQLAGGVAHNFNNLLTVILGNLELAQKQPGLDARLAGKLARVQHAGEAAATVTRQLLAFSRQQLLSPKVIEAAPRLRDLVSLLSQSLRGDIRIELDIPDDLPAISVDATQLELALLNVCFNARDAMPSGGTLRFSASGRSVQDDRLGLSGRYLVIELADTGVGIAPDILPRVFDPFFTTKDVGAGSGLGLSQVYGFAQQCGGAVDIDSTVGVGTTVRLYLPVDGTAGEAVRSPTGDRRTSVTVLVVEDNPDVAELAVALLEESGFTVRLAHRARAALDLLSKGEPVDLVFSDIMMPDGMSGIELAEQIRNHFPAIPVLLATGYSDAMAAAAARGLPIISKPYRSEQLRESVGDLLGDRNH